VVSSTPTYGRTPSTFTFTVDRTFSSVFFHLSSITLQILYPLSCVPFPRMSTPRGLLIPDSQHGRDIAHFFITIHPTTIGEDIGTPDVKVLLKYSANDRFYHHLPFQECQGLGHASYAPFSASSIQDCRPRTTLLPSPHIPSNSFHIRTFASSVFPVPISVFTLFKFRYHSSSCWDGWS